MSTSPVTAPPSDPHRHAPSAAQAPPVAVGTLVSLLDALPVQVWTARPDGSLDYVNRQVEQYFAPLFQNVTEWNWLKALHPDDVDITVARWRHALATGEPYETSFRVRRGSDGAYRWHLVRAYAERAPDGSVNAWFGSNTDVEDMHAAQAREAAQRRVLERERAERNAVLAQIAEGVIVTDPAGQIVFINEAAQRIHGVATLDVAVDDYTRTYQLRTMAGAPYPTDDLPLARAVRNGEHVLGARWRILRPDGSEVVAEGSAVPFRGEDGEKLGAVLTIRDVTRASRVDTERERALWALKVSEERYRSLIDASAQIVWTNNPEGRMEGPQPGWEALTGQRLHEYAGFGWASALHPDDRAHTLAAWNEAVAQRAVFLCAHRAKNCAGVYREFSIRAVPVLEVDGSVREWVGVHTDITDQRAAERERESLIAALEVSNRELDQFAYVASHDLKAPLRGITNLSSFIEEDLGDAVTADVRGHLALLRGRVQRMEALIEGILAYARAGRSEVRAARIALSALFRETLELLAPPSGVTVTFESDVEALTTERTPLQQVLLNLLGNALKYGRNEGGRIAVTVRDCGRHVLCAVRDDGPGIAPEFHGRVWGIFQRLAARDEQEGTGIGLSVVKKIVEARGQRAWLESEPGKGASFFFTWEKGPEEPA